MAVASSQGKTPCQQLARRQPEHTVIVSGILAPFGGMEQEFCRFCSCPKLNNLFVGGLHAGSVA
jgi:hypothetical protein